MRKKHGDMVDWWFSALGISFFPLFFSLFLDILNQKEPSWKESIKNGDLILIAIVLCLTISMHGYMNETHALCKWSKVIFHFSHFACIFIAVVYAFVKSQGYSFRTVVLFSIISLALVLPLSYASEYILKVNSNG